MGYTVFSAFDGMSCGQIAFKELGIKIDKYYASEVDKYAIIQTQHNFPNTIQLGSIVDVDVSKLDKIDILIGGSPCQSFSFAGKRNGMTTTENEEIYTLERYLKLKSEGFQFEGQSYLFWEYMRILTDIRKYNPDVKFLLENVEMGDKWERVLSESIGIFGVHINSALVSAQNRKRIYWTNIRVKEVGLFGELHSDIPQPEDEGILLKDILEEEVDEKYYLSEKGLAGMLKHKENNTNNGNGFGVQFITRETEKSNSILQRGYKDCKDNAVCVAMRGRNPNNPSDRTSGSPTEQRLEPNLNGKTNTITTVQKDNLICIKQLPRGDNKGVLFHDKCPTLTSNSFEHNNHVISCDFRRDEGFRFKKDGKSGTLLGRARNDESCGQLACVDYRIRRLTPTEASRLQTIPEWYKWVVSETQQYKMLGNGWTVKVIMHILKYLS
jgi:DNA (cytosine-5)-methyltransferase 1